MMESTREDLDLLEAAIKCTVISLVRCESFCLFCTVDELMQSEV